MGTCSAPATLLPGMGHPWIWGKPYVYERVGHAEVAYSRVICKPFFGREGSSGRGLKYPSQP
eukprot:1161340-Pelagomonas_calceolata.AAC.11